MELLGVFCFPEGSVGASKEVSIHKSRHHEWGGRYVGCSRTSTGDVVEGITRRLSANSSVSRGLGWDRCRDDGCGRGNDKLCRGKGWVYNMGKGKGWRYNMWRGGWWSWKWR